MENYKTELVLQSLNNAAFTDEFVRTRRIILGLTIGQILNYLAILLPLDLCNGGYQMLFLSIPFIALYNVIECICFFGCKKFSFCTVLPLRILFVLHDCGYFIAYCFFVTGDPHTGIEIAIIAFLFVAMVLNITTMVLFSKLPRYDNCCCMTTVFIQQPVAASQSKSDSIPTISTNEAQVNQVANLPPV